jgi:hypothetical protein
MKPMTTSTVLPVELYEIDNLIRRDRFIGESGFAARVAAGRDAERESE